MNRFQRYLRHIVYLEDEIDRDAAAAGIRKNIYFRGPNESINKNEVIRDLNDHYLKKIQELNQTITELQIELARYKGAEKAKASPDSLHAKP